MFKTMLIALYFLNSNGVPQVETHLFDTFEECTAYSDLIVSELKFWRDSGGKMNGSMKMPWIDWRISCQSLRPKWKSEE